MDTAFSNSDLAPLEQVIERPPERDAVQHSPSPTDPEWDTLPVTSFDFTRRLVDALHTLEARDLFRNNGLNPRDTYIGPPDRSHFSDYLQREVAAAVDLRSRIASVAQEEFAWLRSQGRARSKTYEDYLAGLSEAERSAVLRKLEDERREIAAVMRADGRSDEAIERTLAGIQVVDPHKLLGFNAFTISRTEDGLYSGAELSELPRAQEAQQAFHALVVDIAYRTVNFMVESEVLSTAESEAMIDRLHKRMGQ